MRSRRGRRVGAGQPDRAERHDADEVSRSRNASPDGAADVEHHGPDERYLHQHSDAFDPATLRVFVFRISHDVLTDLVRVVSGAEHKRHGSGHALSGRASSCPAFSNSAPSSQAHVGTPNVQAAGRSGQCPDSVSYPDRRDGIADLARATPFIEADIPEADPLDVGHPAPTVKGTSFVTPDGTMACGYDSRAGEVVCLISTSGWPATQENCGILGGAELWNDSAYISQVGASGPDEPQCASQGISIDPASPWTTQRAPFAIITTATGGFFSATLGVLPVGHSMTFSNGITITSGTCEVTGTTASGKPWRLGCTKS